MAQNDTHVALIILTTQMWGGIIGGKNFFGPNFVFLCLWRQHPFLHKTKGPTQNPISPTPPPPPPSAGVHVTPPPPPQSNFQVALGEQINQTIGRQWTTTKQNNGIHLIEKTASSGGACQGGVGPVAVGRAGTFMVIAGPLLESSARASLVRPTMSSSVTSSPAGPPGRAPSVPGGPASRPRGTAAAFAAARSFVRVGDCVASGAGADLGLAAPAALGLAACRAANTRCLGECLVAWEGLWTAIAGTPASIAEAMLRRAASLSWAARALEASTAAVKAAMRTAEEGSRL